jgi:chitodextrinase
MNTATRRPGHFRRAALALGTSVVMAASVLMFTATPSAAADPLPDGKSSLTAAGSCWEAKQNYPASTDGLYWLLTPALKAPAQFYCDMTTDGGGWVLVGRGREGWKNNYNGLRTPDDVRNTVTGQNAFLVAQLPALTVDGLLNNGAVSALTDGVRLRRATNTTGTTWQEVRFAMPRRDRWIWTFRGEHPVGSWRFDTTTGSGGTTNSFGNNTQFRRVDTNVRQAQGWVGGFGYGSGVAGQNAASSYLYSATSGAGNAIPFTQVYLRPRLRISQMTFAAIPDAGAPAQTLRAMPDSDARPTVWGVTGQANGVDGELNTEVSTFAQIGNRVYVGGNFQYVQRTLNATGANKVERHFLAAFDVNTGEFIPGFQPALNNQVKALVALPDGRLAVGGQFSQANGAARSALVIVDATTGQTTGWQVDAENRTAGGVAQVRGLTVNGQNLYVSGAFTHLVGSGGVTSSSWNGARINLAAGAPDTNWNPNLNGTSVGVEAATDGTRAYYSGYFSQSGAAVARSGAAFGSGSGAPLLPWAPTFSSSTNGIWQLGVAESAGRIYLGGSEHSLFGYDRNAFGLLSGSITKAGGDFQVVEANSDTVFAGCHCGDFNYQDAYTWSNVGTNWTQGDSINLFGAWDSATGRYIADFNPITQARRGFGVWAIFQDSTGTLWAGGDLSYSTRAGQVNQWAGGFTRFAMRDSAAPSTPGSATATPVDGTTALLSWSASSDNRGVTGYEVIRDNKAIGTTTATEMSVPVAATPTRYFVRAVDAAGNRSATTPVVLVSPPSADDLTFVVTGDSWRWQYTSATLPTGWNDRGFNDSSWSQGPSFLGFNSSLIATDISVGAPSPRPLSAQFRRSFSVTDPSTVVNGLISVVADDGVVVYVNGVEIGRSNMPTGTLTQNSFATAAPRQSAAAANRVEFAVPDGLLVAGTNVVAASTHLNYRSSIDASFDLRFTAKRGTSQAPAAPSVTATATGPSTVQLSWTHPSPASIVQYIVSRNGTEITRVNAPGTSFTDTGLTAETAYSYSVVAVDGAGRQSAPGTAQVTTPSQPTDPYATLVAAASQWRWEYIATAWNPAWNQPGFDDSSWSAGGAPLGFGSALGTDISVGAPSPRPLSAQFRHVFTVTDPGEFATATVSVRADDGVVVYLNGTEIARGNMPTGTLGQNTYATAAPRTTTANANPVVVQVPVSLLVAGQNVLAASTHLNYRSTPDASFDLTLTAVR